MMFAKRFEILRNVESNGRIALDLPERPVRVATLINEVEFLKAHEIRHHVTVFLEDRVQDWDWYDGKFRYYTRVAERADVLVVYEMADVMASAHPA